MAMSKLENLGPDELIRGCLYEDYEAASELEERINRLLDAADTGALEALAIDEELIASLTPREAYQQGFEAAAKLLNKK